MRTYSVKVNYSYVPEPDVEFGSVTYEVEAVSPEAAGERAEELWGNGEGDIEAGEDHEITGIGEPVLLP